MNDRLARHLQAEVSKTTGQMVFKNPGIFSEEAWISLLWQQLSLSVELPYVLSEAEATYLLSEIVRSHFPELAWPVQIAKVIFEAYRLLAEYEVTLDPAANDLSPEALMLAQCISRFDRLCLDQGYTSACHRIHILKPHLKRLTLPEKIIFEGFDTVSPSRLSFRAALSEIGVEIQSLEELELKAEVEVFECVRSADEFRQALTLAKQSVNQNYKTQMAIVVPELHAHHKILSRLALEILGSCEHFTISMGMPLPEVPVIRDALCILKYALTRELSLVPSILNSPFVMEAHAHPHQVSVDEVHFRQEPNFHLMTSLRLKAAFEALNAKEPPLVASLNEWAKWFLNVLKEFGWPGERALISEVHQAVAILFQKIESDFKETPIKRQKVGGMEAYRWLLELLNSTPFQPQDSPKARIHILGLLEATPLSFDAMWVTGLTDNVMPARPNPNPLIPIELQRALDMPRSSSDRELKMAQRFLNRMQAQCKKLYLSYSRSEESILRHKSPLLSAFPKPRVLAPIRSSQERDFERRIFKQKPRLYAETLPVSLEEKASLKGGAQIFLDQSSCAFKAFIRARLQVEAFPEKGIYLAPSDRGIILHQVLEVLWRELKDQRTLLSHEPNVLREKVSQIVKSVLTHYQQHLVEPLKPRFFTLETYRLERLVLEWLELEKTRPYFRVVEQEKQVFTTLHGLPVTLRIDRIDECEGGMKVILDYKTSRTSLQGWFGERPEDLQLPLYAVIKHVDGVAFAELSSGRLGFSGVSKIDLGIEGIVLPQTLRGLSEWTFDTLFNHWKTVLENLAQDFLKGNIRLNPTA
ncbi:MAG: hypothetical protein EBX40_02040, partial [Gammaproteobacteria bacterium]|nr:hypothetical protein [Gammaproteobacteria bacterium]